MSVNLGFGRYPRGSSIHAGKSRLRGEDGPFVDRGLFPAFALAGFGEAGPTKVGLPWVPDH